MKIGELQSGRKEDGMFVGGGKEAALHLERGKTEESRYACWGGGGEEVTVLQGWRPPRRSRCAARRTAPEMRAAYSIEVVEE